MKNKAVYYDGKMFIISREFAFLKESVIIKSKGNVFNGDELKAFSIKDLF